MDLEAMRIDVREALSFTTADDTRVDGYVNAGALDFRRDAQTKVERVVDVELTGGTDVYDLTELTANGVLRIVSMTAVGAGAGQRPLPLEVVDAAQLDELGRYADAPSLPGRIAVMGLTQFVLWPTPSADVFLNGWVVPRPDALVDDADVPDEPEEYHRTIVYRAIQIGLELDRQAWDEVQAFEQRYLQGVGAALAARKRIAGKPKSLRPSTAYGAPVPWSMRREVGLE